jgi:hypothetical protein
VTIATFMDEEKIAPRRPAARGDFPELGEVRGA